MNSIMIILIVMALSAQHVTKKNYNIKLAGKGTITFSALSAMAAALFFIFQVKLPLDIDVWVVPYSLLFALGYGSAIVFSVLAISCGSLSLTSLITSYSLIIPTLYGMFFLKEKISVFLIIGLILLMVSIFFINFSKGDKKADKITLKWLIYVAIAFLGNGFCSTVQKVQQLDFNGAYKAEFMTIALISVVAVLVIIAFFSERKDISISVKKGIVPITLCGIANGATNLLVMMLAVKMSASVMYPLISAGSIILTYSISRLWYKEKLSLMQNIGFVMGIASVVFLNL